MELARAILLSTLAFQLSACDFGQHETTRETLTKQSLAILSDAYSEMLKNKGVKAEDSMELRGYFWDSVGEGDLVDGWKQKMRIDHDTGVFRSAGEDGRFDTPDDFTLPIP